MSTHKFIRGLVTKLIESDKRRLNRALISLNTRNKEFNKSRQDGFIFAGERHIPIIEVVTLGAKTDPMPTLDRRLIPEMQFYLKDRKDLDNEALSMTHMFHKLLSPCKDSCDLRDALPECLINYIPDFRHLSRRRPAAYTLDDDERSLRQYHKLLPKIEAYSIAQLIY